MKIYYITGSLTVEIVCCVLLALLLALSILAYFYILRRKYETLDEGLLNIITY